jgi:hypothetical protein
MPRRNYQQARKGQVYAVEWPEWHVECAEEGCDSHALVAGVGECMTAAQAESEAIRGFGDIKGWERRDGLWYCPQHARGVSP